MEVYIVSVPVQPMADYVVVSKEVKAKKSTSGLYLPESATEKSETAKVAAVGSAIKQVKVGDKILYKNEYDTTKVKIDGQEYIIVSAENIVATIK